MENPNPVPTPMDHTTRLDNVSRNADARANQRYTSQLSGATCTPLKKLGSQPDIAHAVAALCRWLIKPYKTHMTAAKRVLRYLKHTADAELVVPGPGRPSEG